MEPDLAASRKVSRKNPDSHLVKQIFVGVLLFTTMGCSKPVERISLMGEWRFKDTPLVYKFENEGAMLTMDDRGNIYQRHQYALSGPNEIRIITVEKDGGSSTSVREIHVDGDVLRMKTGT